MHDQLRIVHTGENDLSMCITHQVPHFSVPFVIVLQHCYGIPRADHEATRCHGPLEMQLGRASEILL